MINLNQVFRAGFVRRWHTNPDLAHTNDRIDGHSARVARIILAIHPDPSLDLIRMALVHDDGESVIGDTPAPFKRAMGSKDLASLCAYEVDAIHQIWGHDVFLLDHGDIKWLRFADRLDALMWARHHAPHIVDHFDNLDGWLDAQEDLHEMAEELISRQDVRRSVQQVIGGLNPDLFEFETGGTDAAS